MKKIVGFIVVLIMVCGFTFSTYAEESSLSGALKMLEKKMKSLDEKITGNANKKAIDNNANEGKSQVSSSKPMNPFGINWNDNMETVVQQIKSKGLKEISRSDNLINKYVLQTEGKWLFILSDEFVKLGNPKHFKDHLKKDYSSLYTKQVKFTMKSPMLNFIVVTFSNVTHKPLYIEYAVADIVNFVKLLDKKYGNHTESQKSEERDNYDSELKWKDDHNIIVIDWNKGWSHQTKMVRGARGIFYISIDNLREIDEKVKNEYAVLKDKHIVTPINIDTKIAADKTDVVIPESSTGCVSGDCQNGQGVYIDVDGKYVGEFKDNSYHGKGVYTYSNGGKYVGEWKDDLQNGKGIYTYADGRKYEGGWKDGKYNGQGIYTYLDGRKYEGGWKDGKYNGKGIYTYADGRKYEGGWKDGKYNGQGIETLPNGKKIVGEFRNGKLVKKMREDDLKKLWARKKEGVAEKSMKSRTGVGSLKVKGFYLGMHKSEAFKKMGKGVNCYGNDDLAGYLAFTFDTKNKTEMNWYKWNLTNLKICTSKNSFADVGVNESTDDVIFLAFPWRITFGADKIMSLESFMKRFVKAYKLPNMKLGVFFNRITEKMEKYYSYNSPKGYRVTLRGEVLYLFILAKTDTKKLKFD